MTDMPVAVVSVPCPKCGPQPRPGCADCDGHGVLMLRVHPEEAALPTEELLKRAARTR